MPAVVLTTVVLRDAMFDELDKLRNGTSTAATANATARLADQICSTVLMELEFHKIAKKYTGSGEVKILKGLALGRD